MSSTFAVGQLVQLAPPPHAFATYKKQGWVAERQLEVVAVRPSSQSVTGAAYVVRFRGETREFEVPEAHLKNPDIIVRARRECVGPRSLEGLLGSVRQFAVPLYQRKYCWDRSQWAGLWADMRKGALHNLGRIVLYEETWRSRPAELSAMERVATAERTLLVVDGQQRLTTCALLLAALGRRDVLFPLGPPASSALADVLRASVLVPTQDDREAFAAALLGQPGPEASRITRAYAFFREIAQGEDAAGLAEQALRCLRVLYFELDDGDAVTRFFEQLHQRQMMLGKLMANSRPGVDLAEVDLLRNYILGHFATEEEQAAAYSEYWLELERTQGAADGDLQKLREFLEAYLRVVQTSRPAPGKPPSPSLYGGFREHLEREMAGATDCAARTREILRDLLRKARSSAAGAPGVAAPGAALGEPPRGSEAVPAPGRGAACLPRVIPEDVLDRSRQLSL